ncbi:tripartite motif-containing protein 2-like [Anneissia japonica]|uniref:tripartite motif-containing protein 2-like n=1 Tax=Anneissia japonica TaxID=1529436 RepID=UPI0014255146|nr:tripartite motif-containing protein 2-like [Anneissia japonica]
MKNKPEETPALQIHKETIDAIRDTYLRPDQPLQKTNTTPVFIPSTHLDDLMNTECIGKITTVDPMMYKVSEDFEAITATKAEPFVVKVTSLAESDVCQLVSSLINASGEESATKIEYQGSGEYKIIGRCDVEGDWQMRITAGAEHIKGSPVNVKVKTLGIIQTIENIAEEHNKTENVTDLAVDTDGCILVSSNSKNILKFHQSGSFVDSLSGFSYNLLVARMHQMGDGDILHSGYSYSYSRRIVTMYNNKYKYKNVFYNKEVQYPFGLTVNKKSRVLYVADCGNLLGKIGSEGSEIGQLKEPQDVTLTKEGHVIVADFGNNRIQMFDSSGKMMRVIVVGCGEEDGKVMGPHGVTMNMDENLIVSSNHKLQLFDKNGIFIKRIDHEDDGLYIPVGCTVLSHRPRIVAVANHGKNNIKIFKY